MTISAMVAYSADKMVFGILLEVITLITMVPSWYLVNLRGSLENDNAYLSFPYHLISYLCNISISYGFYLGGNIDYEIIVWKSLLWLPFVIFHGIGYVLDYKKRFKTVKFD